MTDTRSIRPGSLWWAGGIIVRKMMLVFVYLAFCVFSSCVPVAAAEWRNHTNVNAAHDLQPYDDLIWAATTGGLVLFDHNGYVEIYTNANGLRHNDLSFVTVDSAGRVWTGGRGGWLTSWDPRGNWASFSFIDRDGRPLRLSAAAVDGDLLWVASNVGVHKFDTKHFGGEITETYRMLGDLPADEPVNDVKIVGDHIWAATGAGCAVARTDDINLQDYSHWRSFSENNSGLVAENTAALAEYDGIVYAATNDGLYTFVVTGADSVWSLIPGSETEIFDLFRAEDEILAATAVGILSCTAAGCGVLPSAGMAQAKSRAVCQAAGIVWAASYSGLGYSLYDGSTWIDSTVAGIASNTVHDLAVSPGSRLWATHPYNPTSMWDGSNWELFDSLAGGPTVNCLAVDHEGAVWFGTHGGGATRYNPALPDAGYQHFDETNSPLRGTEPPPNDWYTVVWDIVVDDSGRVWLANTFDYDDRVLVFYDHGCWGYFGTGDGFDPVEPISLFPLTNEVLIGFDEDGLADVEFDSTVSLCIDGSQVPQIPRIVLKDETDGLPTRQVRCLLVDVARKVWVGTSGGLAYFDPVWGRFRTFSLSEEIPAPTINALAVDGGNNVWVGADEGLFIIEPNEQVTHYTPNNSGLANEMVSSLAIDDHTNTLWVGTAGGISEFIGATESATPVEEIIAFPNPLIISHGDEVLTFDAAFGTTIQIYTAAGELVADIGAAAEWDGRNEAGNLVASGVYVFVATDADGNYGRGKFVIIRQ